ncbi:hypothetical protein HOY80DRAFT_890419, partial [Tuber brumale]
YKRTKEADRYLVSFMPFLSKLIDCHVKFDIFFTINIFTYLAKYLFIRPDQIRFNMTSDEFRDELAGYIDA